MMTTSSTIIAQYVLHEKKLSYLIFSFHLLNRIMLVFISSLLMHVLWIVWILHKMIISLGIFTSLQLSNKFLSSICTFSSECVQSPDCFNFFYYPSLIFNFWLNVVIVECNFSSTLSQSCLHCPSNYSDYFDKKPYFCKIYCALYCQHCISSVACVSPAGI